MKSQRGRRVGRGHGNSRRMSAEGREGHRERGEGWSKEQKGERMMGEGRGVGLEIKGHE